MKVLITGASGFLGGYLLKIFNRYHEVIGIYNNNRIHINNVKKIKANLIDGTKINQFLVYSKPDVIIHCAGIASPDVCENNQENAYMCNFISTRNLIKNIHQTKLNPYMLFISTNYVFGGEKNNDNFHYSNNDLVCPSNYYGMTKALSERLIIDYLPKYAILRLPVLYGDPDNDNDPVKQMLKKIKCQETISIDDKELRYPTYIGDVGNIIENMINKQLCGIMHFSADESLTRYQWFLTVAKEIGLQTKNMNNDGIYPDPDLWRKPAFRPKKLDIGIYNIDTKKRNLKRTTDIAKAVYKNVKIG
jgi:dTDP-4-dehydrorhamnose reductase